MCTIDEKKDLNIVMPLCRSCDGWYENGFISVDSQGKIICVNKDDPEKFVTDDLAKEFQKIENNVCLFWNDYTKDYFEWHYITNKFHLKK